MAATQDVTLEEVFWRSPHHLEMMGGFLHSNNILFYFAESPFFDATSNNASLAVQASYNEAFRHFVETREAFESRLETMHGLEFMVAYDPLQAAAQSEASISQEVSNIWVIRKQMRWKRAGMEDEVVVLSTYYTVGDSVFMAPSVASVVGNRILSAVTSLTKLLNTASLLPIFSPSYGHTYMPSMPRASDVSFQQTQPSQQSKEATPMPDAPAQIRVPSGGPNIVSTMFEDTRGLAEALNLLSRYGDEFMDENPLVGEPGSFILSKSSDTASSTRQPGPSKPNVPVPRPGEGIPTKTDVALSAGKAMKTEEESPEIIDPRDRLKRKKSKAEL